MMEDYIQKLLDTNGKTCSRTGCNNCELIEFYYRRTGKRDCYDISADGILELIGDYLIFKKMLII